MATGDKLVKLDDLKLVYDKLHVPSVQLQITTGQWSGNGPYTYSANVTNIDANTIVEMEMDETIDYLTADLKVTTGSGSITLSTASKPSNTVNVTLFFPGVQSEVNVQVLADVYSKSQTDTLLADVYSKSQTDTLLAAKVSTSNIVNNLTSGGTTVPLSAEMGKELNGYLNDLYFMVDGHNAGSHNSIYRGVYLGSSVSSAQWEAIKSGTFDDLFVGDYWTINGVKWRIAGFNYWYNTGDIKCEKNHAVIVPDTKLASCAMNSTDITTGAYVGSDFYTGNNGNTGKATAISAVNNAFGSGHILSHRELLANATSNGASSFSQEYDSTVELMNEQMVYGSRAWGNQAGAGNGYDVGIDKSQLPLFRYDHSRIGNRATWWLRSVVSASSFAVVYLDGSADYDDASRNHGVRPVFGIFKS